jgi:regulatory protein YycI of two-component signal transduction system YycFG
MLAISGDMVEVELLFSINNLKRTKMTFLITSFISNKDFLMALIGLKRLIKRRDDTIKHKKEQNLQDNHLRVDQILAIRSRTIQGVDLVMVRTRVLVEGPHSKQILNIY